MEIVRNKDFFLLLNDRVFMPVLGRRLSLDDCRDLVNGIADVILTIVMDEERVHFGRLGIFKHHVLKSARAWNPKTRKVFVCGERRKIVFTPSKGTTRLLKR